MYYTGMSDLSTNTGPASNGIGYQSHANSRPKFQPIRVKELLHYYESDDDESEDKLQDSDTESDSDELQPLPQDDSIEGEKCNYDSGLTREASQANVPSKPGESPSVDDIEECETNSVVPEVHLSIHNKCNVDVYDNKVKDCDLGDRKTSWSVNFDVDIDAKLKFHEDECNGRSQRNLNSELNHEELSIENTHPREQVSQSEERNSRATHVDVKRQLNGEQQAYKNDFQSSDQQKPYRKSIDSEFKSIASCNLQKANTKVEMLEQRLIINEEQGHNENIFSTNKSVTSDVEALLNSVDQLALQTPLKHAPATSSRPDPCFSRRNIVQTPQTKLPDMSKNHGLITPSTVSSHWSQNNVKQTPLQNKSASLNFMQTPNSVYFTSGMIRHETPRYLNTEGKARQPLADAGSFPQNSIANRRLIQGSQASKVNTVTPKLQNKLSSENLNNKTSMAKQTFKGSENVAAQLESDVNEQLKENKYRNVEDRQQQAVVEKIISNSTHAVNSNSDNKESMKSVQNESESQYPVAVVVGSQSQQQEPPNRTVESGSGVQFSMPSKILKSKQSKSIFVKGKEYLILGKLGQGMSGEVLRVQDVSSPELRAIKCVNLNCMDKDSAQGCLEEISMLRKLQAPCVVKMFDYEIKYPMVYVVMEMGDTDLSRLLKTIWQEKQIPLTMILYYWTEMLTAVKHIHDNGVIHSDLKPANFLLVRGRLKLIDFGIASSMNADMTSVVKNCPIGTLNYISPEALMDIGGNSDSPTQNVKYKISFKSDVWSLGCILYSLVYGHTPFHHIRSQWAKVHAITNPKPNIHFPATLPLAEGDKAIPSPPILIDVMRKCLQHNPKARPTVAELLQIQYVPAKQEHMSTSTPEIPANILVKIKHALNEDEWRQLIEILENRRYT